MHIQAPLLHGKMQATVYRASARTLVACIPPGVAATFELVEPLTEEQQQQLCSATEWAPQRATLQVLPHEGVQNCLFLDADCAGQEPLRWEKEGFVCQRVLSVDPPQRV